MMNCGFTLIELLIVVAIIGILAAIAIPNFLLAQTRAKVATVKAEHQSISVAMEMYRTDWNTLPSWPFGIYTPRWYAGSPGVFRLLTTPTQYVSDPKIFYDEFMSDRSDIDRYVFYALALRPYFMSWGPNIRDWGIRSYGPDRDDDAGGYRIILYDPTNGIVSNGDIWRIDGNAEPDASYQRF